MNNPKDLYNIIVYDKTDTEAPEGKIKWPKNLVNWVVKSTGAEPNSLTFWWKVGSVLQAARNNADIVIPVASWHDALDMLNPVCAAATLRGQTIGQIQFWGHGRSGRSYIGGQILRAESFEQDSPFYGKFEELKSYLSQDRSALWFRNCAVFHGQDGKFFGAKVSEFFGCRVYAHTYLITFLQPGLHGLSPGETPSWTDDEGGETEDTGMPTLTSPNMVLATTFYPPPTW